MFTVGRKYNALVEKIEVVSPELFCFMPIVAVRLGDTLIKATNAGSAAGIW